jgi:putative ABC transport system ATP-binding protein
MADTEPRVLVAAGLEKTYHVSRPPRPVLRGINLQVRQGEFVALMGPSGCGKSTLLHVLGGLEPPDDGSVTVEEQDIYALHDEQRSAFRRDRIGFVFQFFNLIPSLTAAENIALPLQLRRGRWSRNKQKQAIADRVSALMTELNLEGLQGHGPEEISGGEQQRVAIARALAAAPALLLADEPTGNLDWTTGHDVMALLSGLCRSQKQTTLIVTHEARVAAYADRVLVMRDGDIIDEITNPRDDGYDGKKAPSATDLVQRLNELKL